jgi:hypothetical protein
MLLGFARTARAATLLPSALLQIACSATIDAPADPYAWCADLGDLSVSSSSRSEAERQMMARVRELGGDLLIFGERGRSSSVRDFPPEIVQRRDELVAAARASAASRQATQVSTQLIETPGQLWYYGAALRCNLE